MNPQERAGLKCDQSAANKIAIVGMSCLFPGAPNLASFWMNIVNGVDAVADVPAAQWNEQYHYRQEPESFEHIYCKRGGFITDLASFDPLKFGVMPNSIEGFDPDQLLALRVACEALADAGYSSPTFDGSRTEVILGRTSAPGGGTMNMVQRGETIKEMMQVIGQLNPELRPEQLQTIKDGLLSSLRQCNSDTIPGQMPNILAGRIAGRLGLKGRSVILDAACASSLIATEIAVADLLAGTCDIALAGGIHVNSFACFYEMFCGLGALSRKQQIRPFDQDADGTLLGEGLGMVVLKRLDRAIKDGDRIYATICGIASSSDGQGTSMLAPSSEGEALAMTRAYEMANIDPHSVALLEAHGTGTLSGDTAELKAIEQVFGQASEPWCALGTIKSMIGHCQAASGIAGLIKTALALYHKILPATLHVSNPTRGIDWSTSSCYVNSETRTWINPTILYKADAQKSKLGDDAAGQIKYTPRRAAVSAFGFGGVNAHAVLEELEDLQEGENQSLLLEWESEICLFKAADLEDLKNYLQSVCAYLASNGEDKLKDVAYTLGVKANNTNFSQEQTLAVVASSTRDLLHKLQASLNSLENGQPPAGTDVYYTDAPQKREGKLAFVLPGLGAAYPNMLSDLCMHLPDVRAVFDFVDELAIDSQDANVPSRKIFPRPFGQGESSATLAAMDSAVVTVLLAEWAIYTILKKLEIAPDAVLGCSTGEFAALTMCGAIDIHVGAAMFYRLSTKTARSVSKERLAQLRTVVVAADYDEIAKYLHGIDDLYLGAALSSSQTMLSGPKDSIRKVMEVLTGHGIEPQPLPMAIPYHTPLVEGVLDARSEEILQLPMSPPSIPAWSCSTMQKYPDDVEAIRKITTELFTHPIMLKRTVQSMYEDGVRVFVEVGPKGLLSPLVSDTLSGQPHVSVATNSSAESSITQLNRCLAELAANGVKMNLNYLFKRRCPKELDFTALPQAQRAPVMLNLGYPEITLPEAIAQQIVSARANAVVPPEPGSDAVPLSAVPVTADPVVENYLHNMAQFHENLMGMQEQLMRTYLQAIEAPLELEPDQMDSSPQDSSLPLLRNGLIECFVENDRARADVFLTLDSHRYLLDHAIGGVVSQNQTGLTPVRVGDELTERVYLLPLTVALEIMAEAASLLCPAQPVVKIKDVRAMRRIRVGRSGCRVSVACQLSSPGTVKSEIQICDNQTTTAAMSCIIEFAAQLAPSPAVPNFNEPFRAPIIEPPQLYSNATMFHGPRMQSVLQLHSVSKRVIEGTVAARPAVDWFPFPSNEPQFLLDPLLLDNATHLVLYHLFEHQENVTALLPFLVESVDFYCQLPLIRGTVRVAAVMNSSTSFGTAADVYIYTQTGQVLARFTGISSRRISLNNEWKAQVNDPLHSYFSSEIEALQEFLPQAYTAILSADQLPDDEATTTWCLDYVLSGAEQNYYQSLPNAKRKKEWLGGRLAAKEAVRRLLAAQGIYLCSADVIIEYSANGQPQAVGEWQTLLGANLSISITHKDSRAAAVAAFVGVGIDMETLQAKESGFEKLALSAAETEWIDSAPAAAKNAMIIKLWSAKEAFGKAVGSGMSSDPRSLCATLIKVNGDYSQFQVAGTDSGSSPSVVHSIIVDDFVLSCTALTPVYSTSNA